MFLGLARTTRLGADYINGCVHAFFWQNEPDVSQWNQSLPLFSVYWHEIRQGVLPRRLRPGWVLRRPDAEWSPLCRLRRP